MNKLLLALAALALATLALCGVARAESVTPHTLVAHANDQQFWLARIDHLNNADFSFLDFRVLGQDDRWQRLARFEAAIDDITSQGATAAVLLRDKSWSIVYSGGTIVSPGPLPASSPVLAIAGSPRGWWAVGQTPGGLHAALAATATATRPTTRHSSTTQPATAPTSQAPPSQPSDVPSSPVLFQLSANTWTPLAQLPDLKTQSPHVALAVIDQTPYVALYDGNTLSVLHLDAGHWSTDYQSQSITQLAAFKLLGDSAPPRLWVQQQTGPDTIIPIGKPNPAPMTLAIPSDVPAKDRDVVLFGRSIRLITRVGDKLFEQRFAEDTLQPQEKPTELALPEATQLVDLQALHTLVAIVSLMLVLLGWFRQQAATEGVEPNLENVTLAPIGRRFLAGLIDASPVILTMAFFLARHRDLPNSVPQSRQFLFFAFYWSSGLFYILHTTLIETYAGRSLGKIMLGLRVVTLQGATPDQPALFSRNALRLFDLSLFFFPTLFIPFAPLHQRSGDLVAGTVVVLDQSRESTSRPDDTHRT